jgi:hypothetical protein
VRERLKTSLFTCYFKISKFFFMKVVFVKDDFHVFKSVFVKDDFHIFVTPGGKKWPRQKIKTKNLVRKCLLKIVFRNDDFERVHISNKYHKSHVWP